MKKEKINVKENKVRRQDRRRKGIRRKGEWAG